MVGQWVGEEVDYEGRAAKVRRPGARSLNMNCLALSCGRRTKRWIEAADLAVEEGEGAWSSVRQSPGRAGHHE